MTLKMTSSAINKIDYDDKTELLKVTFNSGGTYDYPKVPKILIDNWKNAPSKGKFFHKYIKQYSIR